VSRQQHFSQIAPTAKPSPVRTVSLGHDWMIVFAARCYANIPQKIIETLAHVHINLNRRLPPAPLQQSLGARCARCAGGRIVAHDASQAIDSFGGVLPRQELECVPLGPTGALQDTAWEQAAQFISFGDP
jgi:hypothetical protein